MPNSLGTDLYLAPSLPVTTMPQHSFAGYGGLGRDVYFFVVCLKHRTFLLRLCTRAQYARNREPAACADVVDFLFLVVLVLVLVLVFVVLTDTIFLLSVIVIVIVIIVVLSFILPFILFFLQRAVVVVVVVVGRRLIRTVNNANTCNTRQS